MWHLRQKVLIQAYLKKIHPSKNGDKNKSEIDKHVFEKDQYSQTKLTFWDIRININSWEALKKVVFLVENKHRVWFSLFEEVIFEFNGLEARYNNGGLIWKQFE